MILYVYVLHQVSRLSKFQDCCCKYLQGIRDKQLSLSGTLIRSTQCHRASSLLFWIRMECGSQTKPIPFHLGASLHSKTGVSPKCKGCRMLQQLVCYVLSKAKSSGNVWKCIVSLVWRSDSSKPFRRPDSWGVLYQCHWAGLTWAYWRQRPDASSKWVVPFQHLPIPALPSTGIGPVHMW